jgi:hypothetical protein
MFHGKQVAKPLELTGYKAFCVLAVAKVQEISICGDVA